MCNLERLLHRCTFLVEWLNNFFSSNNELPVFIPITSLNQCAMDAPVLSHFELPPEASGNIKAKCKHSASYISGLKGAGQHLKTVVAKASNIVNSVRKSVNASKILEGEKKLQASNATLWKSQLYMIKSILNVPEEKLNKTECKIQLSTYERKYLSELCTFYGPFEHVTILVQKENNIHASLTVPVTIWLRHQMHQISSTFNNKLVSTFKRSIKEGLLSQGFST